MKTKLCSLFAAAALLAGATAPASAYSDLPDTMQIGLYYGSRSQNEYTVKSAGGLQIAYENDAATSFFAKDSTVDTLTISKNDSYHLELVGDYATYLDAWNHALEIKKKDYDAFVAAVNGTFKIWIGTYANENDAVYDLKPVTQALGIEGIVLYPHTRRILLRLWDGRTWISVQDNDSALGVYPLDAAKYISINGKSYRGSLRFYRQENSDMTAVNVVGMEAYLYGVVPKEVTPSWNMEVVKAQAVMARSFAASNKNKFARYGFNLDDTTTSQVYGGTAAEHPRAIQAVDETAGQVVTYQGKAVPVYYFGSSGGHTEDVENVWGGEALPYMRGVDDSYENQEEATNAVWTKIFTQQEVKEALASAGVDIGDITAIEVLQTSPNGRAIKTKITGTTGEKEYAYENIRFPFGLPSHWFTVTLENNTFIFSGRGWGHGAGLSQWGAKGMADAGIGYIDIIKHYFTGVEVD